VRLNLKPGDRFGRLVLKQEIRPSVRRRWVCVCDCGAELPVWQSSLRSGNTASCGCYRREATARNNTTHGESHRTPEYGIWKDILRRCRNANRPEYRNYGGRGITICDEWANDYRAFLRDVGRRPTPAHNIDRINNAGNYEPGNVRWATDAEQSRNTRRNVIVTIDGRTMVLQDWINTLGVDRKLVENRLRRGWSEEMALKAPKGSRRYPGSWSPARRQVGHRRAG
jgi:hypothetical protein